MGSQKHVVLDVTHQMIQKYVMHGKDLALGLKRTYNEVLCLCHRNLAENQVGLPLVDPA